MNDALWAGPLRLSLAVSNFMVQKSRRNGFRSVPPAFLVPHRLEDLTASGNSSNRLPCYRLHMPCLSGSSSRLFDRRSLCCKKPNSYNPSFCSDLLLLFRFFSDLCDRGVKNFALLGYFKILASLSPDNFHKNTKFDLLIFFCFTDTLIWSKKHQAEGSG